MEIKVGSGCMGGSTGRNSFVRPGNMGGVLIGTIAAVEAVVASGIDFLSFDFLGLVAEPVPGKRENTSLACTAKIWSEAAIEKVTEMHLKKLRTLLSASLAAPGKLNPGNFAE